MSNTLERGFRNVKELAEAILDNDDGVLEKLMNDDPEWLISAALTNGGYIDLGMAVDSARERYAEAHANYLWETAPHIYKQSRAEADYEIAACKADLEEA